MTSHDARRRPTLRNDELDPALTEVSRKVIGCAIDIHKALGPGFDASVYERALSIELKECGVDHDLHYSFPDPLRRAGHRPPLGESVRG